MKQKRFIKIMRAAGYPPYIIREAVDAVKSCGGRISYSAIIMIYVLVLRLSKLSIISNIHFDITEELKEMWRKENPHINGAGGQQ